MRDFLSFVGVILLALCLVVGLSFLTYELASYFQPRYRDLDYKVFKNSEQYNDGMVRDLEELETQYVAADAAGKAALKPIIIHRFEVYPQGRLPADLQDFYSKLQGASQ